MTQNIPEHECQNTTTDLTSTRKKSLILFIDILKAKPKDFLLKVAVLSI